MNNTPKRIVITVVCLLLIASGAWGQQAVFKGTYQGFKSKVIDFREDGLLGCIRGGILVYPSPADLEAGDVFIDVDGNAKKVAAVEKVGKDIYIDTVQPDLEEVFDFVYIPDQTIAFGTDSFLPDGVAAKDLGSLPDSRALSGSFETYLYGNADSPTFVKFGGSVSLAGGVSIGFLDPGWRCEWVEKSWYWIHWWELNWWYVQGYVRGSLNYDLSISAELSAGLQGSKETEPILLYGFGTPTAGITANAGLFSKLILEGSITLSLPVTFRVYGDVGAKCTLDGQFPVMWPSGVSTWGSTSYSVSVDPSLTAEASLKHKIYLGTAVTVVGIEVTDFEAGGGPYVTLSGTLSGHVGYDSNTGLDGPSWSGEASGEIGMFMTIDGKICNGLWSITVFDRTFPFATISISSDESKPGRAEDRLLASLPALRID